VDDREAGFVTFTGEYYSPSMLRAFRIGQIVLSLGAVFSLIAAIGVAAGTRAGDPPPPVVPVLVVLGLMALVALIVWKIVLVRSVHAGTVRVRSWDVQRLRVTPNWTNLWWWLLIGPFSLIVVFSGRRVLRVEIPNLVDGRVERIRLELMEQHHGDADAVVARLRMAGAR
jgi:hypothetical protein